MSGSLSAHSPKFNSKLVTLAELETQPEPVALGIHHKPVSHARLIHALYEEFDRRDVTVQRAQFALGANGAALFGVLDLQQATGSTERALSFGFRNSINQSLALRAVAGNRVFVCDNLVLSGDVFAIKRKNTTGLDLFDAIARGFDKFMTYAQQLTGRIEQLQAQHVSNDQAKVAIYDTFARGIVPVRLLDDVNRYYFDPQPEQTDCQPRTLFGVHNAFTRAMRDLTPQRLFSATVALGRRFGL